MRADPLNETYCAPVYGQAQALYFDSNGHKLFGWLHKPYDEPSARFGLVICKPFGREEMCAHRGVRAFARAAAALAIPSLLFDYLGTGDSADIDPLANQLEVWTRDVLAAVAELQRRTHVERVGLLGFRLGALLAAQAAIRCKAVSALMMVAPVISGKRYLHELRVIRLATSISAATTVPDSSALPGDSTQYTGAIEVNGHFLSKSTVEALAEIDLTLLTLPPAPHMLVFDDTTRTKTRAWIESLSDCGAIAQHFSLPGVAEMFINEPQFAAFPHEMIGAMGDWLQRMRPQRPSAPKSEAYPHPIASLPLTSAHLPMPAESSASHAVFTERPAFITSSLVTLFGIVTEPHHDEGQRRAVILLNSGADSHIGANRLYVSLARSWASQGYTTLRLDLAGLGDSEPRPERPDNDVFPSEALDDIRSAIEFIRTGYNIDDISLCGICSGAYHAFQAARAGLSINRILMVNQRNFSWNVGVTTTYVARDLKFYGRRAFSAATWKSLLIGRLNVRRVAGALIARAFIPLGAAVRDGARRLRIRVPRDLGSQLEEISARGVRLIFVFAGGEPGLDMLKFYGGSSVARLGERCAIRIIETADHTFTSAGARAALQSCLSTELAVRNAAGVTEAAEK